MSSRKRDLIERVRYPNPLPLPPYPPKLVDIPTPPTAYAHPTFGDRLARAHPLPVIVDGMAGMDIDLTRMQALWQNGEGIGDASVAPRNEPTLDLATLDEEDAFLLSDFTAGPAPIPAAALTNGHASGAPSTAPVAVQARDVTWLRRTEYLGSELAKQRSAAESNTNKPAAISIDTSVSAHIERIEATFAAARRPLSSLQHPTKRHLTAVESFDVLPDIETWGTEYQILRYVDWPGRTRNAEPIADARLSTALLRPVVDEMGASRLSLYLPTGETKEMIERGGEEEEAEQVAEEDKDELTRRLEGLGKVEREDEMARLAMRRRRSGWIPEKITREVQREEEEDAEADADAMVEMEEVYEDKHAPAFRFVRDYELADQAADVSNQLVLVLDDGSPEGVSEGDDPATTSGADTDHPRLRTLPPQSAEERELRREAARAEVNGDHASAAQGAGFAELPRRVAYYHPIKMKTTLRMRRLRRSEARGGQYESFWDGLTVSHRPPTSRELLKRRHARSAVDDLGELEELVMSEAEVEAEYEADVGEGEGEGGKARYDVDGAMAGVGRELEEKEALDVEGSDEEVDEIRATQRRRRREQEEEDEQEEAEAQPNPDGDATAATAPQKRARELEEQEGRGASPDSAQDRDLASGPDEEDADGGGGAGSGSGSGSDSESDDDVDDVEADEELAALREEAVGAGAGEGEEEGGRGRRRRAAPTDAGADDGDKAAAADAEPAEASTNAQDDNGAAPHAMEVDE